MNSLCIRELAEIIEGELQLGSMPPLDGDMGPVGSIVVDSRQVEPGDLFWGLKGERHDGSMFAEEAFARDASGVVVCGRHVEPWGGKFSIEVEDSKWALWQLACWARRQFDGRVIAVTGDTRDSLAARFIEAALGQQLDASTTIRPDNQVGLPLEMLRMDSPPFDDPSSHDEARCSVLRMCASARGEIDSISHLCCPHIAVINCLAKSNASQFESDAAHRAAHLEVLAALPDDGWAVLDGDDAELRRQIPSSPVNVLWVGRHADCDLVAENVRAAKGRVSFVADGQAIDVACEVKQINTALAAFAVGRILKIPPRAIAAALSTVGRSPKMQSTSAA